MRLTRYGSRICMLVLFCLSGVFASSAEKQETAQYNGAAVNPATKAAVNGGALSCAGRINQVINFLSDGSQGVGAQVVIPSVDPDRKLLSISLEIQNENMPAAYAGTCFAPNQANGCGAMYETVVYWNKICDDVAAKQFAGLKRVGAMRKEIAVLDGGADLKVFLMPAGSGCVSIKKEVIR